MSGLSLVGLRQWQSCCRRCPHGHPSRHTSSMPGELPLNPDIQLSPKSVTKARAADFPEVPSLGSRAKGGRMETPPPTTIAIVWEAKLSYRFPSFPAHIDHQRLHAKPTQTCFASFSTQNNARIIDAKTSITGQSPSLYHHLPQDHQSSTHPALPQFLLVVLLDLLPSAHSRLVVCNWLPSTCSGNRIFPDRAHNNSAMASRSKPPKPVVAKLSILGKPVDPRPTCIGDPLKINSLASTTAG